jgi:copper transport protein
VRLLLLGGIALLFGATLQARERTGYEPAYWPLMLGVALSFSATGHAATTAPNGVSVMLDVLHLCAMSAWLGGLVLVLAAVLPRAEPAELAAAIPVFSRVAFWSVVTLAVSGAWAAWHGVGLIAGFTTEYGLLVLGKILLFLGLVVLGNVSRTVVQRRWARVAYAMTDAAVDEPPPSPPIERLRRSVIVEVAVAAVVLAVTAVLVGQPRGKEAVAVRNRQPVTASTALGGGQTATVTISPGVHGHVDAQVTITGGTAPQSVTGSASLPSRHLGPIPLALHRDGADLYSTDSLTLPAAGSWQIALTVTRSQFDAVTAEVALTLH